jgi:transposase
MEIQALLPDSGSLGCDRVVRHGNQVVVMVSGARSLAACPACGRSSDRVHSQYVRRLADLPWQGLRVEVQWRCRRFFCINPYCRQQIFSERLPEVAEPYARKTRRLTVILRAIAFVCGGEEGARLLDRLAIPASPDTLLREIRRTRDDNCPTVRVVGVDDWALRRGQRYGTILVDLERHCPVDLLPERSAEALASWLGAHPEVEVVSRDRGDCYIKGAEQGAPQATQVTDRWHLLHNLQEAIVQVVDRHRKQLKDVAKSMRQAFSEPSPAEVPSAGVTKSPTKSEQARDQRRQRRLERYQQVVELHAQGVAIREIARRLHMQRRTVRLWMARDSLPERAVPPPHHSVDIWTEYLQHRWQAGCHNASALTAELKAQGYKGSYDMVRRCVAAWRQPHSCMERCTSHRRPLHCDSPRSIAWTLMKSSDEEEAEQQKLAKLFRDACPEVNQAVQLALQFRRLVTERRVDDLDDWIARSVAADAPAEIRRFAAGLKPDLMAVKAALSLPWSNGQTEGQVNRLKRIKRQMYGRANFDLLRLRVLARIG